MSATKTFSSMWNLLCTSIILGGRQTVINSFDWSSIHSKTKTFFTRSVPLLSTFGFVQFQNDRAFPAARLRGPCEKNLPFWPRRDWEWRAEQQSKYLTVEGSWKRQSAHSGWSLWVLNRLRGLLGHCGKRNSRSLDMTSLLFACFRSPIEWPL